MPAWLLPLLTRRMLICVFTGFASGLPLSLLITLIPAWLRHEGGDLPTISLIGGLVLFPFSWKFLWAPVLDRFTLFLGLRRGWMLVTQIALLISMGSLGFFNPQEQIWSIALVAVVLAFFSATQDIALDAFRREILPDSELGLGNSIHVNAYRLAGLIPGSLSLYLADPKGAGLLWNQVFQITSLFVIPGLLMTLFVREPKAPAKRPKTLQEACVEPFREFIGRIGWQNASLLLLFLVFYKLGDSLATHLATPFYYDMGFSLKDIGLVAKHAALWPAVIGGVIGGLWMTKIGINRALWIFGIIQMVTILGFAWLASIGPFPEGGITFSNRLSLATVIAADYLGVGLGTTAFVAFIARATHPAYTATQFALFTSLAALPRFTVNTQAGDLVQFMGWTNFYLLCTALAIPGMLLLLKVAPWDGDKKAEGPKP